jgi:hypothetical protein
LNVESKVAIAACIRDVSKAKPNRGEELLHPLSQIVVQETHPLPLTFALEAMSVLCDGAGVDYFNGWRIVCKNPLLANIFVFGCIFEPFFFFFFFFFYVVGFFFKQTKYI